MNTKLLLTSTLFLFLFFTSPLFSQIAGLELKLQRMPDRQTWGVFVKPSNLIHPSEKLAIGTGQVTLLAPVDFDYKKLNCHAGAWVENARVDSPREAPGKSYVSFGFEQDYPKTYLAAGSETLLFTIVSAGFEGELYLIDNENDPFAKLPNSTYTNPGNDLQIVDFAVRGDLKTYSYAGNYQSDELETEAIMTPMPEFSSQAVPARFVNVKEE